MFPKSHLVQAFGLLCLVSATLAIDLIEMNDVNKNKMTVGVIRSLKSIQEGVAKDFKFDNFEEALLFVDRCRYLRWELDEAGADGFEGLAPRIRSIIEDPEVKARCDLDSDELADYSLLAETPDYLSKGYLRKLVALGERLANDEPANRLLGGVMQRVAHESGLTALDKAAEDTSLYFGELDESAFLSTKYLSGCRISAVKPICQFVRGTKLDSVSALASDLHEFSHYLAASDDSKLSSKSSASGISLTDFKDQCHKIIKSRDLHAIEMVNLHLDADYLSEQEIKAKMQEDEEFAFYFMLNKLCQLAIN